MDHDQICKYACIAGWYKLNIESGGSISTLEDYEQYAGYPLVKDGAVDYTEWKHPSILPPALSEIIAYDTATLDTFRDQMEREDFASNQELGRVIGRLIKYLKPEMTVPQIKTVVKQLFK